MMLGLATGSARTTNRNVGEADTLSHYLTRPKQAPAPARSTARLSASSCDRVVHPRRPNTTTLSHPALRLSPPGITSRTCALNPSVRKNTAFPNQSHPHEATYRRGQEASNTFLCA